MNKFVKFHKPGQGVGYTPPMDARSFRLHCISIAGLIVLTLVDVYLLSH